MRWWPFRRSEKRSISLQDLWGTGADVEAIRGSQIGTALTLAPVWSATRLIADSIAALPLQAYRRTDDKRQPMATPSLFTDPSIFGGPYEWVQRALVSLLLRGNAYGLITSYDATGYPRQIEWLHPDEVSVDDDRTVKRPQWYWLGRRVEPWLGRDSTGQLLHIPWYVIPGQVLGLSPIQAFATTIETGVASQRFGRDWFINGGVPPAVLESDNPVDEDQAKIIVDRFLAKTKGRRPVVLGAGAKYKPISVPHEESQFLETIKANATQIASIYGLWPEDVGGESGSSMTYANVEHQSISRLHRLSPYMAKLEEHFSMLLPRPQYMRFNFDALLRADLKTRYETHAIALANKFKTADEVRELEDLPPLTDEQKAEILKAAPKPKPVPPREEEDPEADNVVPLPRVGNQ